MEKILARLRTESDEFKSVFTPEQTAMMKRVFDQVCRDNGFSVEAKEKRETLALVILRATKTRTTEPELLFLARRVTKNL